MFTALRDRIILAATDAVVSGGAGITETQKTLYDELPNTLPALCTGPARTITITSRQGAADVTAEVGVLAAYTHGGDTEMEAAEDALELLVASLRRKGLTVFSASMVEDDWAGRACFTASLAVHGQLALEYS
ncbi:MAG: hypothetical protein AAF170_15785 [Bacteroidota bacterium]